MKSFFTSTVLAAASLSSIATVHAQFRQKQTCPNNGETLEFRFFTDAQSFLENGWHLQCEYQDGSVETVWDVPPGTLKYTATTQVIRESTCVEPTTSCWLTIEDLGGDGLLAVYPDDGFAGWFALIHGSRTVAVYSNEPTPAFEELHYCVGPKCKMTSPEIADSQCEKAYLYLQTDGKPQDTSYELTCNGETLWKRSGFSVPGDFVEEETCIANDLCCTFTIHDEDTNGMTTPTDRGFKGFAYLEWNFDGLLEYDGISGEEFDSKTVEFGHGCREPWQDEIDFPVEDVNDPVTYGDHGAVLGGPINDEIFSPITTRSRGLSDVAKIVLFTVAGLILFCCLVVLLFYRRVLTRDDREHIKDDPTVVASPTRDDDDNNYGEDPSVKREPLSAKDEHAGPATYFGDDRFIYDDDEDSANEI